MDSQRSDSVDHRAQIANTHWSVVMQAARTGTAQAEAALETLCRTYWRPLYAYVRRRGYSAHDAEDLTQEFFARLLRQPFLSRVGPEKGRFRSFLLASMNNFLANEWDRVKAEKRGGKVNFISLEEETAESRFVREDIAALSAEGTFDQQWAVTLLQQAMLRLQAETAAAGKGPLFDKLKRFLESDPDPGDYAQLAADLHWTQGAVAVAVHRLRVRYRGLVAEEVSRTVADPGDAEDELRRLLAAMQSA